MHEKKDFFLVFFHILFKGTQMRRTQSDRQWPTPASHPSSMECESLPAKKSLIPHYTHSTAATTHTAGDAAQKQPPVDPASPSADYRCITLQCREISFRGFPNTSQIHLKPKTKCLLLHHKISEFSSSCTFCKAGLLPHICSGHSSLSNPALVMSKIIGCNSGKLSASWRWTQQLSRTKMGGRWRDRQI